MVTGERAIMETLNVLPEFLLVAFGMHQMLQTDFLTDVSVLGALETP